MTFRRARRFPLKAIEGKICIACDKPLVPRPMETLREYTFRRVCDRQCSFLFRKQTARVWDKERYCPTCKKRIVQKPTEAYSQVNARRYCGRYCATFWRANQLEAEEAEKATKTP